MTHSASKNDLTPTMISHDNDWIDRDNRYESGTPLQSSLPSLTLPPTCKSLILVTTGATTHSQITSSQSMPRLYSHLLMSVSLLPCSKPQVLNLTIQMLNRSTAPIPSSSLTLP